MNIDNELTIDDLCAKAHSLLEAAVSDCCTPVKFDNATSVTLSTKNIDILYTKIEELKKFYIDLYVSIDTLIDLIKKCNESSTDKDLKKIQKAHMDVKALCANQFVKTLFKETKKRDKTTISLNGNSNNVLKEYETKINKIIGVFKNITERELENKDFKTNSIKCNSPLLKNEVNSSIKDLHVAQALYFGIRNIYIPDFYKSMCISIK